MPDKSVQRHLFDAKMAIARRPLTKKQREAAVRRLMLKFNPQLKDSSLRTVTAEINTMHLMRPWHDAAIKIAKLMVEIDDLLDVPAKDRTRYEHAILDALRIKKKELAASP